MRTKCYFGELDGFREQDKISYSHMFTNLFSSSEQKDRRLGPINLRVDSWEFGGLFFNSF